MSIKQQFTEKLICRLSFKQSEEQEIMKRIDAYLSENEIEDTYIEMNKHVLLFIHNLITDKIQLLADNLERDIQFGRMLHDKGYIKRFENQTKRDVCKLNKVKDDIERELKMFKLRRK